MRTFILSRHASRNQGIRTLIRSRGKRTMTSAEVSANISLTGLVAPLTSGEQGAREVINPISSEDTPSTAWVGYAFTLIDPLPLVENTRGFVHYPPSCVTNPRCRDEAGEFTCTHWTRVDFESCEFADQTRMNQKQVLSKALNKVLGIEELSENPEIESKEREDSDLPKTTELAAVVRSPVQDSESLDQHFYRTFEYLKRLTSAIMMVADSYCPELTIERTGLYYFWLQQSPEGELTQSIVIVPQNIRKLRAGDIPEVRRSAVFAAIDGINNNFPTHLILRYRFKARSAFNSGDYEGALINSAICCEVLIKMMMWVIMWESEVNGQSLNLSENVEGRIFDDLEIHQYFETLKQILKGNWDSRESHNPVGAWKHFIQIPRSKLLHKGKKIRYEDAFQSMEATQQLIVHLNNRLGVNVKKFPISCVILMGQQSLAARKLLHNFRGMTNQSAFNYNCEFVEWLDGKLI